MLCGLCPHLWRSPWSTLFPIYSVAVKEGSRVGRNSSGCRSERPTPRVLLFDCTCQSIRLGVLSVRRRCSVDVVEGVRRTIGLGSSLRTRALLSHRRRHAALGHSQDRYKNSLRFAVPTYSPTSIDNPSTCPVVLVRDTLHLHFPPPLIRRST